MHFIFLEWSSASTNSAVIQSNERPEGIIYSLCSSPVGLLKRENGLLIGLW